MAKKLFGQSDKKYDEEYWGRLERNWKQWKGGQPKKRRTIEMIKEEEDESGVREWTEEDNKEMGNTVDPYYELQGNLREGWCYDLAKWLKSLFTFLFFSFLFWTYYTRMECEKVSHD